MRTMLSTAILLFATSAFAADLPPTVVTAVSHGISLADQPTINRCNAAIAEWAAPYNPVAVETTPTEPLRRGADGARIAILSVDIDYLRKGGIEPRSATIACTVESDGQVKVSEAKE